MTTFDLIGGPHDGARTALPPGHTEIFVVILDEAFDGEVTASGGVYRPGTHLGQRGKLFWHPNPPDKADGT